jgi:predicted RNase H-like HicB family nuclease
MKHLQHSVKAIITEGDVFGYVGSCFGLPVVTQGASLDEVVKNLKEAVELHFEGENLSKLGFVKNPSIIITFELEPVYAKA